MTTDQLARLLHRAAEKGESKEEKMVHLILFGIKYAGELDEYRGKATEVVRLSGVLPTPSTVEVNQGRKLAQYVTLNDETIV